MAYIGTAPNIGENRKLDDMNTLVSQQNVLLEKFANMDRELKESFGRVWQRIEKLEDRKICPIEAHLTVIKTLDKRVIDLENAHIETSSNIQKLLSLESVVDEKIKVSNNRLTKIEASITWITRVIIGALLTGAISTLFILARG